MRLKVGHSIDGRVITQFKARQAVNEKDAYRLQYTQLSGRVPYVRMSSLVRIKPDTATALAYPNQEGWKLAQNNVLHNNNSVFKGAAGYENYSSLGIRPMPGITGMNIVSHNRFGSVRTATVNFVCWAVEELDKLELLFMRPGFSVLLEWGHSVYITGSSTNPTVTSATSSTALNPYQGDSVDIDTLWNSIYSKKESSRYNYDGIVGMIKNFSWSFRADGGYDCTVSLVTQGDLLESHKANIFVPQSQITTELGNELSRHITETQASGSADVDLYLPTVDTEKFPKTGEVKLGGHEPRVPKDNYQLASMLYDIHPKELQSIVDAGESILIMERLQKEGATVTAASYTEFISFVNKSLLKAPDTVSTLDTWDKSKLKIVGPGVQVRSTKRGLFTTYVEKDYEGLEYDSSVKKVVTAANPNVLCNPITKSFAVPSWIFCEDGDDYGKVDNAAVKEVFDAIFGTGKWWPIKSGDTLGNIVLTHDKNNPESVDSKSKFQGIFYGMETGGTILNYMYARRAHYIVIYINDELWKPGTTTPAEVIEASDDTPLPPEVLGIPASQAYASQLHWELLTNFREKYIGKVGKFMGPAEVGEDFAGTYLRGRVAADTDVSLELKTYPSDAHQASNYAGGRFKGEPKTADDSGTLLTEVYINLGNLLGLLNKYIIRSNDKPLFQFYTNTFEYTDGAGVLQSPPEYFTFKDHLSVDPTICILPHTMGNDQFSLYGDRGISPTINNILLGTSFVLEVLNKYISSNGSATMLEFLEDILANVVRVTGGVNDLELQYSEPDRVYTVVDRRYLGKSKHSDLLEISLSGLDSVVRNVNMISKVSSKLSSMVAISAQDNAFTSTEESTGFSALSKDLEDGVYKFKQDEHSVIQANTAEELAAQKKAQSEKDIQDLAQVLLALQQLYIDGILPDNLNLIPGQYENYCKRVLGRGDNSSNNFIIPFELQLTLDGISGFGVMEAFRINKKILPYTYGRKPSSKIGFLVTGVEHSVNTANWQTTIKSQIFNMDEVDSKNVPASGDLYQAIREYSGMKTKSGASADYLALTTDTSISALHPEFAKLVNKLIAGLKAKGYNPRLATAFRSLAEQLEKYEKGFSQVKFGNHTTVIEKDGLLVPASTAIDIIQTDIGWSPDPGKDKSKPESYSQGAEFFKAIKTVINENPELKDLKWGGDWSQSNGIWKHWGIGWDPAHVEWSGAEYRKIYNRSKELAKTK